ncbi:pentapeptide repeat-containing protein [Actinophytocola sp. S1-96]|uniref:Pentapeptide repeat-containing protein n=1 Tax=Actinophytocola gossypii TaxID=2812003 RepID=A0ABT2JDN2_9PSEU|nr:pentapeptide repeat-containing protein [Actinophytocola gossypii]
MVGTVSLAVGTLALVTGWLLTGENPNRREALQAGGLAAGSVVALYALWLNDRRRRVDEERQELDRERQRLESDRAEHDRERAADERFLRAVELLGSEADQVRVGALHALGGLARSRPAYTQDVLDVICSYLRRPFDHPRWEAVRGTEPTLDRAEADRWLQVRQTAQALIADLLPEAGTADAPAYDLDLNGAALEYFNISGRVVGQLRLRHLRLYESNSMHHCEVRGPAWFTGSRSWGRLWLHHMVFEDRAWFSRVTVHDKADFEATVFHGATKFEGSTWDAEVSFRGAVFDHPTDLGETHFGGGLDLRVAGEHLTARTYAMKVSLAHDNHLPPSWNVDSSRDPDLGLVRP